MKLKLDENLPYSLVRHLASLGHDADSVFDERLTGDRDDVVWQAAQHDGRFLLTQDLDFSDARKYRPGAHHGLLLVRLAEPGREALYDRLSAVFADEDVESWKGCIVSVTSRKVRVKRPGG